MMKLETTVSHAEDKFCKKFGRMYHLSRSQSKRNLSEPSTSANCNQVLMQGTLDPRMSSSMFEQATTQFKNCQPVNNLHSSLIVQQSNSQVRPTHTVHDQSDIEAAYADINA